MRDIVRRERSEKKKREGERGERDFRVLDAGAGIGGSLHCMGDMFDKLLKTKGDGDNYYKGISISEAEGELSLSTN